VQREILEADRSADLAVYAVWVPFLGGTQESANLSQRVLPDPRVAHFWDGSALTSEWFAENVDHSPGPAWDVYYLYGPQARWSDAPDPLVSSGATIIGRSSQLKVAIEPLLVATSSG
jgi:hypothetical protein